MASPAAGPGEPEAAGRRRRRPPLSALSAFSSVPAGRAEPPELRYFQREAEVREGRGPRRARRDEPSPGRGRQGCGVGDPVRRVPQN